LVYRHLISQPTVPLIGWAAGIIGYVIAVFLWTLGIYYASKGEEKEVPILGEKFQEWFQAL